MKNIELLKQRMEVKASEELFDIQKQPEQQCPAINSMQANVKDGLKEIEYFCKELKNIEGAESLASDTESSLNYYFSDKIDELEKLRTEIEAIRNWGQSWKDLAKSILNNTKKEDDIVHYFSSDCQVRYDELQSVLK
jgi:hypothetical protein